MKRRKRTRWREKGLLGAPPPQSGALRTSLPGASPRHGRFSFLSALLAGRGLSWSPLWTDGLSAMVVGNHHVPSSLSRAPCAEALKEGTGHSEWNHLRSTELSEAPRRAGAQAS